jgi:hypothetical protein
MVHPMAAGFETGFQSSCSDSRNAKSMANSGAKASAILAGKAREERLK